MRSKIQDGYLFKASLGFQVSVTIFGLIALGLTGCASSITPNYYTLAPKVVAATQGKALRTIEVLPIGLPDRLDRPLMMVNTEQGQSTILDNERWTSSLSMELHDSLSAGLQQQLDAVDHYSSGMASTNTIYRIATDFSRFDIIKANTPQKNGVVEVEVSWIIKPIEPIQTSAITKQNLHRTLSCRMTFNQPIADTNSIPDMVSASKLALMKVTKSISDAVLAVESNTFQAINGTCS